ncbi:MAG: retropepsin-like domain-containing protein [candidate division Zixibacteria bacterium]|nr:retropepsin-like domain-containing protein [candidate division Zixibacteria bacterium]
MSWKRTIIAILVLVTAVFARTSIPFDPARGLVEIEVELDGHIRGVFGIDTGADQLYIDRAFAVKNGLSFAPETPTAEVVGVDGSSRGSAISLRSLTFGRELLVNQRAVAIDIAGLTGDKDATVPDGLIGYEVLKQFFVTVDYPAKTLELTQDLPRFIYGNRYHTVPFTQYRHLVIVMAQFDGQVEAPMILDYCASYTSLSKRLAERLTLTKDERGFNIAGEIRVGEKVVSRDVPVVVTDFSLYRRSTPQAEYEGILGASFLREHKITVDYRTQQIYIHK